MIVSLSCASPIKNCAIKKKVEEKKPFLVENHLLCITNTNPQADFSILMKSFKDPRTLEFIQGFFTNNAMNSAEVENILPIFI
jgi:ribosomal protein L10